MEKKQRHVCLICGHVHDEETEGAWDSLPEDFKCPECDATKEEYFVLNY
jgi:rubredoxin